MLQGYNAIVINAASPDALNGAVKQACDAGIVVVSFDGIVTLEDLIEELVGEIVDEFDTEDARIEPLAGGGVRVSGSLPIDDANELLGLELPDGDFDTISGLMLHLLGRLGAPGDVAECDGARLTVERVQGRRIVRVRIERVATEAEAAAGVAEPADASIAGDR